MHIDVGHKQLARSTGLLGSPKNIVEEYNLGLISIFFLACCEFYFGEGLCMGSVGCLGLVGGFT